MWIERILESPTTHAIELTARFAEQRHKVLAENVANVDTPDYHARRLGAKRFQKALRAALDDAEQRGSKRLNLRGNAQVWTNRDGALRTEPTVEPPENVLFHDGTNASLETMMADVQQNSLSYNLAVNLLRGRFDGMLSAIKGRTA